MPGTQGRSSAPIADVRVGLPSDVAALEAEATAEIARFDAEVGAELAPFAVVLLRSESASSSMIENLTSGARAIVLAEMGSTEERNAQQIVGNVAAGVGAGTASRASRGNLTVKHEPWPGVLCTSMRPPCSRTSSW